MDFERAKVFFTTKKIKNFTRATSVKMSMKAKVFYILGIKFKMFSIWKVKETLKELLFTKVNSKEAKSQGRES